MIGPHDKQAFRDQLRLNETEEFSDALVATYVEFKKLRDVHDASQLTPGEVATVCMLAKHYSPAVADDDPPPQYQEGDRIVVLWRNQRRDATFKRYSNSEGRVWVQLDDEGDDRDINIAKILEVMEPA